MAIRITDDTMTVGTDTRLVAAHGLASAPLPARSREPDDLRGVTRLAETRTSRS
jgi:hypothetical protein